MKSYDKASEIIEKLASNEEYATRLYEGYAEAFPALHDFWTDLATEEIQHASWIRNLGLKAEKGCMFIEEGRFNIAAVQTFMKYLKS